MSLVPDYDDSSEESNDTSEDDEESNKRTTEMSSVLPQPQLEKLPTPGFIKNSEENVMPQSSVFANPFIEAENAKKAVLEKHVKMVNSKDNIDMINGKRICWNYRKGKCRFGHNCKYAHDSDLQKSKEQLTAENQTQQTVLFQSQKLPEPSLQELNEFKEEALSAIKKRKRPGLTQGLVPGKKVMKSYLNQKK